MKNFVDYLKQEIDLNKIDYIVMNHNENDHSGPSCLDAGNPRRSIYCTQKAKPSFADSITKIGIMSMSKRGYLGSGRQ